MRLQTSLLSLFLLALVLAPYVDASAKKKKKDKKKVSILSDNSTGRGDAVALPPSPALMPKPKPKPASLLMDTTNTAPPVQLKDQGTLVQSISKERQVAGRDGQSASSPSTSSALTSKPKPKPAFLLVDTTNTAPAVQLRDQSILVQSDHEESQVSERDEQTKKFEELISKNQYKEIVELGRGMNDKELLKCLCQVMTTLDQFKGLYAYLEQREMVPAFLAHGNMVLVRDVIVETDLLETDDLGRCDSIYDAISLSLKEDRHGRVASLFEAARERPGWKHMFDWFVYGFFRRHPPEKDSMPFKRLLTLYGEEFSKQHPEIFESIYQRVQSVPKEGQVSEKDEQTKKFEELINKGQYKEIAKLGNGMNDEELLKCLCQVVTSPDHFKGLYEYLEQRNMVPGFLAHGDMVPVRKVIVETDLLKISYYGQCDSIYNAIALSLEEDRHERAAGLFEAAQARPNWKNKFDYFVYGFFRRHPPEKDSMPLKRFLTLHGEVFGKKHPAIFKTICVELVIRLRWQLDNPASQKLLTDFVGQPSLISTTAFVNGFLNYDVDGIRLNFISYGWKEAIEEGLKEKYLGGGRKLWDVMVSEYPDHFTGEYPSTDGALMAVLKHFKTKQDLEKEWALTNAPTFLPKLKLKLQEPDIFILLPPNRWCITVEYAAAGATWVDVRDA